MLISIAFLHNILADEHVEWDAGKAVAMVTDLRDTLEANGATAIEAGPAASGDFVFVKNVEDEGRRPTTGPSASASDAIQHALESTAEWPPCQSITERASSEASAAAESKATTSSTDTPSSAPTGSTVLTNTTGTSITSPLTLEPTKSLSPGPDNRNAETLTGSLNECFNEPPSEPSAATRQAILDRTETPLPPPTPEVERITSDSTGPSGGRGRRRNSSIDIDAPPAAQAFISQLLASGLREVPANSRPRRTQADSGMLGRLPPPAPPFGSKDPQRATLGLTETPPPPTPASGAVDPLESAYRPPFRGKRHAKSDSIDSDDIPDTFEVAQLCPAPALVGTNTATLALPETPSAPTRTAATASVFDTASWSPSAEEHLARSPSVEGEDIPESFDIAGALPAPGSAGASRAILDLTETPPSATTRSAAVDFLEAAFRPPTAGRGRARTTSIHTEDIPDTLDVGNDFENDDNASEASSTVGKLVRSWVARVGAPLKNNKLPTISLEPSIVNAVSDIMATIPPPLSGSAVGPAPRSPSRGRTPVKRGSMDVEDQPQTIEGVNDWLVARGHNPLSETSIERFTEKPSGSLNEVDVLAAKLKNEVEEWTEANTRPNFTQTPPRSSSGTLDVELSNAVQIAHSSADAGGMAGMCERVNTCLSERCSSLMPKNPAVRRERSFEEMQERAAVLTAAVAEYNRAEAAAPTRSAPPPSSASGAVEPAELSKQILGGQTKTSWELHKEPQRTLEEVEARAAALGAALEESINAKAASASTKTPAQSSSSGAVKPALEGQQKENPKFSDDDLPLIVTAIRDHLKSSGLKEIPAPSASALYDDFTPSDFALRSRLKTPALEYIGGNAEGITDEDLCLLGLRKVPADEREEYLGALAAGASKPDAGNSSWCSQETVAARSSAHAATEQKLVDERLKVQLLKASKLKAEERVGAMNAVLAEMASERSLVEAFNAGTTEGTIATQIVGEIYNGHDQVEGGSCTPGGAGSRTAVPKKDKGKGREMDVTKPEDVAGELIGNMLKGYAEPEPGSESGDSPKKDRGKGKEKEAVKAATPPRKTYFEKTVEGMSKSADLETSVTSGLGASITTQDKVTGKYKLVKSMPAQGLSAEAVASLMKALNGPNPENVAYSVSAKIRSPEPTKRKAEKTKEKDEGKRPGKVAPVNQRLGAAPRPVSLTTYKEADAVDTVSASNPGLIAAEKKPPMSEEGKNKQPGKSGIDGAGVVEVSGILLSQGLVKVLAHAPSGNDPGSKTAGQELRAEDKDKRKGPADAADEGGSATIMRAAAMIADKRKNDKRRAAASAQVATGSQGLGGARSPTTPHTDKNKMRGTNGREGVAPFLPSGARDTETLEKALTEAASACNSSLRAAEQELNKPEKDKEMTVAAIAAAGELTATVRAAKMIMEKRKKDTEKGKRKGPAGADSGSARLGGAQKTPETSKTDTGKGSTNEAPGRHGLGEAPVPTTQRKDEEKRPTRIAWGCRTLGDAKRLSTPTKDKGKVPEDASSAGSARLRGAVQNPTTLAKDKGKFPAASAAGNSRTPGSRGAESNALTTTKDNIEAPATAGFDLYGLFSPAELREQELMMKTLFNQATAYGSSLRAATQNSMTPAQAASAIELAATARAAKMNMEQETDSKKGTGSPNKQLTWRKSCLKKDMRIGLVDQIDLVFTSSGSGVRGAEPEVEELEEVGKEAASDAGPAERGRNISINTDEIPDTWELQEGSIRLDTPTAEDDEATLRKGEVKAPVNITPVTLAGSSVSVEVTPTSPCSATSDPSTSSLGRLMLEPPSSLTKKDGQRGW